MIFKATKWCLDNNVRIFPHPLDGFGKTLKIIVEEKGIQKLSKKKYTNENVYKKIEELYVFVYEREQKKLQA